MSSQPDYEFGTDSHYKSSITTFGNKQVVTCAEDIYSEDNVKLIAKGTKVDSKAYATLIKHKLQLPLDESLTTENTCSIQTIIEDATHLMDSSTTLKQFLAKTSPSQSIADLLSEHRFPESIAFKLTIAKSEFPDLYQHSLVVVCLCYYLSQNIEIEASTITQTLLAALFHDIGLLHIDSTLFQHQRPLSNEERKFLHVHVIVSHLLINSHDCYQGEIANAILEHHERIDGSGYPNGKSFTTLSLGGQILAIAEVMASKFDSNGECQQLEELSLLLKMNYAKLNHDIYKHWLWHYAEIENTQEPSSAYSDSHLIAQSRQLNKIINHWYGLISHLPSSPLISFIGAYINTVHDNFNQAGMTIDDADYLTTLMEQDNVVRQHFHIILNESCWQLNNLLSELNRRKLFQQAQQDTQIGPWLNTVVQLSASQQASSLQLDKTE